MSAFKFHTTFRPTGDQQEDVIAKIDILRSCAVQANLTHQHNHDAQTFLKKLRQIDDELEGGGLDSVENYTSVIRKKAGDLSALLMIYLWQAGLSEWRYTESDRWFCEINSSLMNGVIPVTPFIFPVVD